MYFETREQHLAVLVPTIERRLLHQTGVVLTANYFDERKDADQRAHQATGMEGFCGLRVVPDQGWATDERPHDRDAPHAACSHHSHCERCEPPDEHFCALMEPTLGYQLSHHGYICLTPQPRSRLADSSASTETGCVELQGRRTEDEFTLNQLNCNNKCYSTLPKLLHKFPHDVNHAQIPNIRQYKHI
jgi:hypothetical protein